MCLTRKPMEGKAVMRHFCTLPCPEIDSTFVHHTFHDLSAQGRRVTLHSTGRLTVKFVNAAEDAPIRNAEALHIRAGDVDAIHCHRVFDLAVWFGRPRPAA